MEETKPLQKESEIKNIDIIDECYYCWKRPEDNRPFSKEKNGPIPGFDVKLISNFIYGREEKERKICSGCMKSALESFESKYLEITTVCKICRLSYTKEKKEFIREKSHMFGICGGPSFVCKDCRGDGFSVSSGHGGSDAFYFKKQKLESVDSDRDDIVKKPYYFSQKSWDFVKENSTSLKRKMKEDDE